MMEYKIKSCKSNFDIDVFAEINVKMMLKFDKNTRVVGVKVMLIVGDSTLRPGNTLDFEQIFL